MSGVLTEFARISPRSPERGPVEAWLVEQRLLEANPSLRAHPSAAPLKLRFGVVFGGSEQLSALTRARPR